MATGLEKVTVEVPFSKGVGQKMDPAVIEMDVPYVLRNVHLRKGSVPSKRLGHVEVTDESDGAVDFTDAGVKRLVSLDDELVAITESAGSIGSGGGTGSSGDTVFAFAESAQKWKAFGKIQRPTLDVVYPISSHDTTVNKLDTAVNGNYMVTAEKAGDGVGVDGRGIFATITDLASDTERFQGVIAGSANGKLIKCVATSTYLCVVWWSAITGFFSVTKYDLTALTETTYNLAVGSSAGADNADAATSSNLVYVSYTSGTTVVAVVPVAMTTGTVGAAVTVETFASGAVKPTAITISGAELAVVFSEPTTGDVRIRTGTLTPAFPDAAIDVATAQFAESVRVVIFSSTVRLVFWETLYDQTTETSYAGGALNGSGTPCSVRWARVEGTSATLSVGWGGAVRKSINLGLWGQPFVLNSRVFLPVVSPRHLTPGEGFAVTGLGYYRGAYIVEVEPTISSAQATLMPQAACCLDVVGNRLGRNTSVVSSKAYVAITRRRQDPGDPGARSWYFEHHQVEVCIFDFADDYRWQPAVHDHMAIFSGAYPYVFDGKSTHECGFAWRPEIMGFVVAADGALDGAETYFYRVTFEYRDAVGRRWHSQVSYAVEGQNITDPATTNLTMKIAVSTLSLNMMQDASFYFPGPLYAVLWRATAAQANSGVWVRDTEQKFYPYDTANVILTSSLADADIDDSERLYIIGGEIENYPAPPCRSLAQHRDRLFAYNTEWQTLDYTKPMQTDRGIEWSLSQRIPCPEKMVALASLEHALIAFSSKAIYALEGGGPSSTGIPPDAFARLVLVNADIGCSEVNAAWRCPAGIIFRSKGGFWLLDRSYSVSYIGASVESDFDQLAAGGSFSALCGVVDEKNNCMRIYCQGVLNDVVYSDDFGSNLARFNYWFDTGRWSVDNLQCTDPRWATYHRNKNYIAWGTQTQSGVAVEDEDVYDDIGSFYAEAIETGWIRFDGFQSFKRVWRTLISLEEEVGNLSSLRLVIAADYGAPINSETITGAEFGTSGAKLVRVHLWRQKVRSLKVSLIESEGSDSDSPGFKFHGIGFELGMKRGAYKAATISR